MQLLKNRKREPVLRVSEGEGAYQAELLEVILASMEQGVAAFDKKGNVIATNGRFQEMHELPSELCQPGRHFLDVALYAASHGHYGPGTPETLAQERWHNASAGSSLYRSSSAGPSGLAIEVTGRPLSSGGFVNTYTDITESRAVEMALRTSEARFRLLAEHSSDVVALNDIDGTRRYVSPAAERVLGWRPEEMIGHRALEFVHPEDQKTMLGAHAALQSGSLESSAVYRYMRPDGSWLWVESNARLYQGTAVGGREGYVVVMRDATKWKAADLKLKEALERMEHMARTDGLTGLANRRYLDEIAAREWRKCMRSCLPLSVLMLDADHFKRFNDHYGHLAGDECLRNIASLLDAAAKRPEDLAARYGGEEFVLLMPGTGQGGAQYIGGRLRRFVQDLGIAHEGNVNHGVVTVSVGSATAQPGDQSGRFRNVEDLLTAADDAMYRAKHTGRNQIVAAV